MVLKAAFMFVAPGADPAIHRSVIRTSEVELITVGVGNYATAEQVARDLVDEGVNAIELCGGFGIEGTARVKQAVMDKAVVGVVRFDTHPGLGNASGDSLFAE
ncbi:MAG: DUF6506 family protein [Methanospirillum sp.]|nr:DUF6506 family protein [Methanospirillum sp.]